jgi:hypothetical protein
MRAAKNSTERPPYTVRQPVEFPSSLLLSGPPVSASWPAHVDQLAGCLYVHTAMCQQPPCVNNRHVSTQAMAVTYGQA